MMKKFLGELFGCRVGIVLGTINVVLLAVTGCRGPAGSIVIKINEAGYLAGLATYQSFLRIVPVLDPEYYDVAAMTILSATVFAQWLLIPFAVRRAWHRD